MDTGFVSLPNIYFGKYHMGGLDDLKSHLQNPQQIKKLKDDLQTTSETDSDLIESDLKIKEFRGSNLSDDAEQNSWNLS